MSTYHANADAAFAAIATPTTIEGVAAAQAAALKVWQDRGAYGCEHYLYVDTMRRVSAVLFAAA